MYIHEEESERLLALYYHSNPKDVDVRNRIIVLNYGLVRKVANNYRAISRGQGDLEQVAAIGLIRAVDKFNPNRNCKFSVLAIPYINGEIKHYLRDLSDEIRFPRSWQDIYSKAHTLQKRASRQGNNNLSDVQICEALGISQEKWEMVKSEKENSRPVSLNQQVFSGNKLVEYQELGDTLHDKREEELTKDSEDIEALYAAVNSLPQIQRDSIIMVRQKGLTQREAGRRLGVHHLTISRSLTSAVENLKEIFENSMATQTNISQ